jgi:phenylacetate-CoA ligase
MIFQYNPVDYLIERSQDGELIVTVLRFQNAAPKIRYNIRDIGGSVSYREVQSKLRDAVEPFAFSERHAALPFLFVYGRNDLSVPFYGAKVFTTDIDHILNSNEGLRNAFYGFQIQSREEANLEKTLVLSLERSREPQQLFSDSELQTLLFMELQRVNQDFREVSKLFGPERIEIQQHEFGAGPFATRDIRVKNKYIGA